MIDPITNYILEQEEVPIISRLEREVRKVFPIGPPPMLDSKCKKIKKEYNELSRKINSSPERQRNFKGTESPKYKELIKKAVRLSSEYNKCFMKAHYHSIEKMKQWYLTKGPSICKRISKDKKELKECLNHCKDSVRSLKEKSRGN